MLSRDRWFLVLIVCRVGAVAIGVDAVRRSQAVSSTLASRPASSASRVTEAPSIDGALDERVWQDAAPLTGFVQAEPFEGRAGLRAHRGPDPL